jgi:hypothetical protein
MALVLQLADSYSSLLLPSQDMNLAIIYSLCTLYIQYICTYNIIKDLSNFVTYLISNSSRHYTTKYLHMWSTELCPASSKLLNPHPPLHPTSVSSPRTKGGGYTLAGR